MSIDGKELPFSVKLHEKTVDNLLKIQTLLFCKWHIIYIKEMERFLSLRLERKLAWFRTNSSRSYDLL